MKNLELECLPGWRFCRIGYGLKKPLDTDWPEKPKTLAEVEDNLNISVVLGPYSGNLMAVDFDGPEAWNYWDKHIGLPVPESVAWSSLKTGRMQIAFTVPDYAVPVVKTERINLGVADPDDAKKIQQFEMRWTGGQSVLPPSLHPETGRLYEWLHPPSKFDVLPIPERLLEHWLETIVRKQTADYSGIVVPEGNINAITEDEYSRIRAHLKVLQKHMPRPSEPDWMRIGWAVKHTVGTAGAIEIMKEFWPEETPGEYRYKLRGQPPGRPVTFGTIVEWCRQFEPELRPVKFTVRNYND